MYHWSNKSCEILLPILATHDGKESASLWMLNYMWVFKFKLKQKYNASMALVIFQALNRHVTSGSHTGQTLPSLQKVFVGSVELDYVNIHL